jgi:hypothetical protein
MIIKKRFISSSRKDHICDDCRKIIPKGTSYCYLYGAPDIGDKPYAIKICEQCQKRNASIQNGLSRT